MDQKVPPETDSKKVCPNDNCKFDNHHKDANFCILCGTLLYRQCDNCLDVNPRYAKFCYYCGTSLEDLRDQSEEELFQPDYHPEPNLEEDIESSPDQGIENMSEKNDDWPGGK